MRDAASNLPKALDLQPLERSLAEEDAAIERADPDKNYPLDDPHRGFYTRESLSAVKPGVELPDRDGPGVDTRRVSSDSPRKNPVYANFY